MGEARNWRWVAPSVWFVLLLLLTRGLMTAGAAWTGWAAVASGMLSGVAAVAAVGNYYDYRRTIAVSWLERRQRALAVTPFAAEMEAGRNVHPDVAKLILNERHRALLLKSGQPTQGIQPHAVLFEAPQVTDIFLRYFLENSSRKAVLPKRLLVEGRKSRFDPLGLVAEYEMYDALVDLLARKGMIRKWAEHMGYEFVAPWEPRLVMEDFGLVWEEPATADVDAETL